MLMYQNSHDPSNVDRQEDVEEELRDGKKHKKELEPPRKRKRISPPLFTFFAERQMSNVGVSFD